MPEHRIAQYYDMPPSGGLYHIMLQNVVFLMMLEDKVAQHHDVPLTSALGGYNLVPRKLVIPIMPGHGIVQHYDMPLSGGLTIPCHRMWSY